MRADGFCLPLPPTPLCRPPFFSVPPRHRFPPRHISISGLPFFMRCIARLSGDPIPKSLGHPLTSARARASECSCLLPTPKISRDSSNHPARHSSITCAVVLPSITNHLWSYDTYMFSFNNDI